MKNALNIPEKLKLGGPAGWDGSYVFDGKYDNRMSLNPWTWFSDTHRDVRPHFTIWDKNITKTTLTEFHITYNFNEDKSKPLHVYYKVSTSAIASYSNTDVGRLGSYADDGRKWVQTNKKILLELASAFTKMAVAD